MRARFFLPVLMILFFGCNNDSSDNENEPFIGTWNLRSVVSQDGMSFPLSSCDRETYFEISNSSGTLFITDDDAWLDCTEECSIVDINEFNWNKSANVYSLTETRYLDVCDGYEELNSGYNVKYRIEFEGNLMTMLLIEDDGDLFNEDGTELLEDTMEFFIYEKQ